MLSFLFISLLVYFLTYLSTSRIDPLHFQTGGRRWRPNLAIVFFGSFYVVIFSYGCMFAFVVCFSLSVLRQEIGWEERLRNDLFCVGWVVI